MGCKIRHACSGGVTHFALSPDEEEGGVMTIAWGQNAANGELGLGPEEPKSATKPTRIQPLVGIDVFESVFSSSPPPFFLKRVLTKRADVALQYRRGPEFGVLPRHPEREVLGPATTPRRARHARRVSDMPSR